MKLTIEGVIGIGLLCESGATLHINVPISFNAESNDAVPEGEKPVAIAYTPVFQPTNIDFALPSRIIRLR